MLLTFRKCWLLVSRVDLRSFCTNSFDTSGYTMAHMIGYRLQRSKDIKYGWVWYGCQSCCRGHVPERWKWLEGAPRLSTRFCRLPGNVHKKPYFINIIPYFFVFVSPFGDVAFSEYFCTITVFSLYGEYVERFFLPGGVFLPCDHGLDFLRKLVII